MFGKFIAFFKLSSMLWWGKLLVKFLLILFNVPHIFKAKIYCLLPRCFNSILFHKENNTHICIAIVCKNIGTQYNTIQEKKCGLNHRPFDNSTTTIIEKNSYQNTG